MPQFIFVDTPGFQRRHRSALNRRMNATVTGALIDVDAVVLVIEASRWTEATSRCGFAAATSDNEPGNMILAINKIRS